MTTTQRDAINGGNSAEGLVIFNTTKNCMQFKSDTGWVSVISSTGTTSTGSSNAESVTIGNQIWSTKNLSVDRYRNGDIIPQVTNDYQWGILTTGAWCWYKNDSANYAATYGRLYNWYAVTDPRGLAPLGWHIPTYDESITLATALGGYGVAGGTMKTLFVWGAPNPGATNRSGIAALPGGERSTGVDGYKGLFLKNGTEGLWWTSTGYDPPLTSIAWYRSLSYISTGFGWGGNFKYHGLSVRCIKD
jgi:uncharacterized protein (TIGR02145 family)